MPLIVNLMSIIVIFSFIIMVFIIMSFIVWCLIRIKAPARVWFFVLMFITIFALYIPTLSKFKLWELNEEINRALALQEINVNQQAAVKLGHVHKSLSKLLEEEPYNLEALFVLAKCEYYQGNWSGAEKKFKIIRSKDQQLYEKLSDFYNFYNKTNKLELEEN